MPANSKMRATENPYAPPKADVHDARGEQAYWRPVLLGSVVSMGTFYSLATVSSPLVQRWYTAQGVELAQLYQTMNTATVPVLLVHVLALAGYIFGGYVAAARTPHKPLLAACLSAVLAKVILLAQYAGVFAYPLPAWSQMLGFVTPVPAALLGGWYCIRQHGRPRNYAGIKSSRSSSSSEDLC